MPITSEVTSKELHELLEIFEKKSFDAVSCEEGSPEHDISIRCKLLFKQDYSIIELDNTNGVLSPRYPDCIYIPEYEHDHMTSTLRPRDQSNDFATSRPLLNGTPNSSTTASNGCSPSTSRGYASTSQDSMRNGVTFANDTMSAPSSTNGATAPLNFQTRLQYPQQVPGNGSMQPQLQPQQPGASASPIYEDLFDVAKVRELITMAKYARCRQRFVVPVILFRGKFICRSATISNISETYGRKVVNFAYDCINGTNYSDRANQMLDDENSESPEDSLMSQEALPFSYHEVIKSDIQLLNVLNVSAIFDLMVEKRKVKYFVAVSSSEKADHENNYKDFNILSLPYPGCEFFKKFRDNNYMAINLHYNWQPSFNDATLNVPPNCTVAEMNINWSDYKHWDLVEITQNYLKACLKYIKDENSGLLIHCISGWDRTPLFVSLVRLSLWADGLIHKNLNPMQMAYLTLAYDWYLFGHQLPDRLKRSEDIMFFCFHVLKFITEEEFSIVEHRRRTKTSCSSGSSVIVLRTEGGDDEVIKEDLILGYDQDSNDSSICDMSIMDNFFGPIASTSAAASTSSVASTSTAASTSSAASTSAAATVATQAAQVPSTSNPLTNRSPNPKRSKTSPISVPGVGMPRQRKESDSSLGSWYMISEAGSIEATVNSYSLKNLMSPKHNGDANSPATSNGHDGLNGHSTNGCNGSYIGEGSNGLSNGGGAHYVGYDDIRSPAALRKKRLNAVRAVFIQAYGKTIGLKFKEGSSMNLGAFIGTIADQLF